MPIRVIFCVNVAFWALDSLHNRKELGVWSTEVFCLFYPFFAFGTDIDMRVTMDTSPLCETEMIVIFPS